MLEGNVCLTGNSLSICGRISRSGKWTFQRSSNDEVSFHELRPDGFFKAQEQRKGTLCMNRRARTRDKGVQTPSKSHVGLKLWGCDVYTNILSANSWGGPRPAWIPVNFGCIAVWSLTFTLSKRTGPYLYISAANLEYSGTVGAMNNRKEEVLKWTGATCNVKLLWKLEEEYI